MDHAPSAKTKTKKEIPGPPSQFHTPSAWCNHYSIQTPAILMKGKKFYSNFAMLTILGIPCPEGFHPRAHYGN
jgi:hypothetical protein